MQARPPRMRFFALCAMGVLSGRRGRGGGWSLPSLLSMRGAVVFLICTSSCWFSSSAGVVGADRHSTVPSAAVEAVVKIV